ncbi:PE-PPE domain-containing protein [[Mycobacterium] crassicus]|uniref:PE-PPE domain-containing protein n=1 Tax=[Mycobacterium] crassicus TaxID=2872309 RepID=A0ABU5XFB5_9MYCO|nr:PE-PPE domain-containing protein [Mycolicibacter sp. MYC098]MEB3019826.1 PE-PPE domain-containing protein [Mycolicibacter sp. MYC098]
MQLSRSLRSLGVAAVAVSGAAVLCAPTTLTPALASGARTVVADVALLDNVALIMGGSGTPVPGPWDFNGAAKYLGHLGYGDYAMKGVFTPEGLYPGTGVKSLPLDTSVDQGVAILDSTIRDHLQAGNKLVVYGVSQSAVLSSLEMNNLVAMNGAPDPDQLSFVLIANEMFPNGGLLSRFAIPEVPLYIPSMGIDFYGATPDTPYATDIYIAEYDGFSDFPRYPLNLLSTLNAILGIAFVHGPGYSRPDSIDSAQLLLGSTNYDGPLTLPDGVSAALNTDYYMIPTDVLPLLQPLLGIPVIGQALNDLLDPVTRILIDLGYGNVDTYVDGVLTHGGWDMGPANQLTTFGVFPPDIDLVALLNSLAQGAQHGFEAFIDDLGHLSLGSTADALGALTSGADFVLPSFTDVVNAVTSAASSLYSMLLPTADIINALLTTMPAYNISLFLNAFASGDDLLTSLVNAIGMPVAADIGLAGTAIGFELMTIVSGLQSIADSFANLFSG